MTKAKTPEPRNAHAIVTVLTMAYVVRYHEMSYDVTLENEHFPVFARSAEEFARVMEVVKEDHERMPAYGVIFYDIITTNVIIDGKELVLAQNANYSSKWIDSSSGVESTLGTIQHDPRFAERLKGLQPHAFDKRVLVLPNNTYVNIE